jgi:hypothetical protein
MQRLYSMFPAGAPGYGLLLLRLIIAISLHFDPSGHLVQNPRIAVFAGLLSLSILLIAGLLAPLAATLGGAAQLALLLTGSTSIPCGAIISPLLCLLVALLGPGAYSVDARLFGRRVLILHSLGKHRDGN